MAEEERKINVTLTVSESLARNTPEDVLKELLGEDAMRAIRSLLRKVDNG